MPFNRWLDDDLNKGRQVSRKYVKPLLTNCTVIIASVPPHIHHQKAACLIFILIHHETPTPEYRCSSAAAASNSAESIVQDFHVYIRHISTYSRAIDLIHNKTLTRNKSQKKSHWERKNVGLALVICVNATCGRQWCIYLSRPMANFFLNNMTYVILSDTLNDPMLYLVCAWMYAFDKSISLDKTSSKHSAVPRAVAVAVLFHHRHRLREW